MPRHSINAARDAPYRTMRPLPHRDPQHRDTVQAPNDVGADGWPLRNAAGGSPRIVGPPLSTMWRQSSAASLAAEVPLPCNQISWIRRVDRVIDTCRGMQMFDGRYVEPTESDTLLNVRPGCVFIVCVWQHEIGGIEHVRLFLSLPDWLWYEIGKMPTWPLVRRTGWHTIAQPTITSWTALSQDQRIIRGCNEMLEELQVLLSTCVPGIDDISRRGIVSAMEHVREIATRVQESPAETTENIIERSFSDWVTHTANLLQVPHDAVLAHVRHNLPAVVQPATRLEEQLAELVAWFPNGRDISDLNDQSALRLAQNVVENVTFALNEELEIRAWQQQVFSGLQRYFSSNVRRKLAADRALTALLRQNLPAAVEHIHQQTGRLIAVEELIAAITAAAARQPCNIAVETPEPGDNDNRKLRRIHLGRKASELRKDSDG